MEDISIIRTYILEAGRPVKKRYKKETRRQRHREYRKERAQILRKLKTYRKTPQYKQYKKIFKRRYARASYRPVKRIYV